MAKIEWICEHEAARWRVRRAFRALDDAQNMMSDYFTGHRGESVWPRVGRLVGEAIEHLDALKPKESPTDDGVGDSLPAEAVKQIVADHYDVKNWKTLNDAPRGWLPLPPFKGKTYPGCPVGISRKTGYPGPIDTTSQYVFIGYATETLEDGDRVEWLGEKGRVRKVIEKSDPPDEEVDWDAIELWAKRWDETPKGMVPQYHPANGKPVEYHMARALLSLKHDIQLMLEKVHWHTSGDMDLADRLTDVQDRLDKLEGE